jgi:hypothetical protein
MRDPLFGTLASWGGVEGAPKGNPTEIAEQLETIIDAHKNSAAPWPIDPPILRALIVELCVHFGFQGRALSDPMLRVLCWATGVPLVFVREPAEYLDGGWKGGRQARAPEAKGRAFFLDAIFLADNGKFMPIARLRSELMATYGERAPQRPTLKAWRSEYQKFLVGEGGVSKPY